VKHLVSPSKTKLCIGGVRERKVDELCGKSDKGVETTEQYADTELMKKEVHCHFYSIISIRKCY